MNIFNKAISLILILTLLMPLLVEARAGSRSGGYRSGSSFGSSYRTRSYQGGGYDYSRPRTNYYGTTSASVRNPAAYQSRGRSGSFLSGLASGLLGAWLYNKLFSTNQQDMQATGTTTDRTKTSQLPAANEGWTIWRVLLILIIFFIVWKLLKRRDRSGPKPSFRQNVEDNRNLSSVFNPQSIFKSNTIPQQPIGGLTQDDYRTFEEMLVQIQQAWSDRNLAELQRLTTPAIYNHFAQIIYENDQRGIINQVSQVNVINQELQDTWQEGESQFARVALTWTSLDYAINKSLASSDPGYLVEGSMEEPIRVTEIWIFERTANSSWLLTEIIQP